MSVIVKDGKIRVIENYVYENEGGCLYLPSEKETNELIQGNTILRESAGTNVTMTNVNAVREAIGQIGPINNKIRIEPIHVGETRNLVDYTEAALVDGAPSWINPINRPVLKDHNNAADYIIGRVISADYDINKKCQVLEATIQDQEALMKIKDKRYLSVSIGSALNSACCSICGKEITIEFCGHMRGSKYNKAGELSHESDAMKCTWIVNKLTHEEVSVVAVPADEKAQIVGICGGDAYMLNVGGDTLSKNSDQITTEAPAQADKVAEIVITAQESAESTEVIVYSYFYTKDGVEDDANTEEAKLKSKTRNALPDSAFALVKTVNGKKVRKLPYKHADGSIDKNHLRNALARINQVQGFSSADKARALAKLKRAAKKAGIEVSDEAVAVDLGAHIRELNSKIERLEESLSERDDEIVELSRTIETMELSLTMAFEKQIDAEKSVETSKALLHKERVERLLDIRYLTNRESDRAREDVFSEYTVKSDEMLLELIKEYNKNIVLTKPPTITNATLPIESKADNDIIEENVSDELAVDVTKMVKPDMKTIRKAYEGNEQAKAIVDSWQKLREASASTRKTDEQSAQS